jgi:hypothetical protein
VDDYARLFFKNKVRIVWQGEKLEIRTREIISEDAVLDSLALNQKNAELGRVGKSGGELILKAQTLKGSLFIRADGQKWWRWSRRFSRRCWSGRYRRAKNISSLG